MRIAIFALFLSTGTAAFCQLTSTAPLQLNQPWVFPEDGKPCVEIGNASPDLKFKFDPSQTLILPRTVEFSPQFKAQIDPQMIVHPPKSFVGDQASGTLVAQNLYPGLQLLPIDGLKAKAEPIPITWPKMKIENIPTPWPDFKLALVETGATAKAAGK
jgi:hypothetical protein